MPFEPMQQIPQPTNQTHAQIVSGRQGKPQVVRYKPYKSMQTPAGQVVPWMIFAFCLVTSFFSGNTIIVYIPLLAMTAIWLQPWNEEDDAPTNGTAEDIAEVAAGMGRMWNAAIWAGAAVLGYRAYENHLAIGWSQKDAALQGTWVGIGWRMWYKVIGLGLAATFTMALWTWTLNPVTRWTIVAVEALTTVLVAGIGYVKMIDRSLFTQNFVYRAFAPIEDVVANVNMFWTAMMLLLPFWLITMLMFHGVVS